MTLSDSWGLPWRAPKPDAYAMSLYRQTINKKGQFAYSARGPWFYKTRAYLIQAVRNRPVFIHELQAEPWVKQAITLVPPDQQLQLMDAARLQGNIAFARQTSLQPIDLWGLEWWYWLRVTHNQPAIWQAVQQAI